MRKATTLKPKIWNSSATLHFWDSTTRSDGTDRGVDNDGVGVDLEQICHGRWLGPSDPGFTNFVPSILGASPFERRAIAAKGRNR